MDALLPLRRIRAQTLRKLGVDGFPGARATPRRLLNAFTLALDHRQGRTVLRAKPVHLAIELTNVCNLRCPGCFTGVGETGRVRSMMPLAEYRRILDELGPYLFGIEFHNWGESLLHPQIWDAVAIARRHGISTQVSTHFSLNFTPADARALVASGLHILGVSLDGASQQHYETYRVRGRFDRVIENVKLVNEAKQAAGAKYPVVYWSFHAFQENQHEVEQARVLARELNMEFAVSKGWVAGPDWDPDLRFEPILPVVPSRCEFLWKRATINNDGGVAPCHGTFFADDDYAVLGASSQGRPGASSFTEAWNNEAFVRAREYFDGPPAREGESELVCAKCPVTKRWHAYKQHLGEGRPAQTFERQFTLNDGFNYFFDRRDPARRRRIDIPLDAVSQPPREGAIP